MAMAETIMKQAADTVDVYITRCMVMIDDRWGEGFALRHPEMVTSLVRSCVAEYQANTHAIDKHEY